MLRVLAVVLASVAFLVSPPRACAAVDLFAVIDRGIVYRSTNGGVSWASQGSVAEPEIVGLTPGLGVGTLSLLGRTGDLYRSTDSGANWSVVGNAGASDCVELTVARDGDLIALTATGDLIRSQDGGASWASQSNAGFSDGVGIAVGGAGGSGDTLFAITASGDVSRSATGADWTAVGNTGYTPIVDLVWTSGTLRALTDAGELLVSADRGATWIAIGTASQVGMRALSVVDGELAAITKEGEVARSATGSAWTWVGTLNQVFVVVMAPMVPEFQTSVGGPPSPRASLVLKAYPNPFTAEVRLRIAPTGEPRADATVTVFDAAGRRVAVLHDGPLATAPAELAWRPSNAPSGIYYARAVVGRLTETERLVLLR